MSENRLLEKLTKLAQEHPEIEEHLRPLIIKTSGSKTVGVIGASAVTLEEDGKVVVEIIFRQPFPEALDRLVLAAQHKRLTLIRNPMRNNSFELSTPSRNTLPDEVDDE
jgi:hypothetical protein